MFGAPDPLGPRVDGIDIFKRATEQTLANTPVQVKWTEDWEFAHERQGEVHCVTNVLRDPVRAGWWKARRPLTDLKLRIMPSDGMIFPRSPSASGCSGRRRP